MNVNTLHSMFLSFLVRQQWNRPRKNNRRMYCVQFFLIYTQQMPDTFETARDSQNRSKHKGRKDNEKSGHTEKMVERCFYDNEHRTHRLQHIAY